MYIPQPEFYVLYNGKASCPDEMTIKLSEMFKTLEPLGLPEKSSPVLELEVKVLNINQGNNLKEAVKKAVKYCCEHDIIKGLLEQNSSRPIKHP